MFDIIFVIDIGTILYCLSHANHKLTVWLISILAANFITSIKQLKLMSDLEKPELGEKTFKTMVVVVAMTL